jgi:hypothetical protein
MGKEALSIENKATAAIKTKLLVSKNQPISEQIHDNENASGRFEHPEGARKRTKTAEQLSAW